MGSSNYEYRQHHKKAAIAASSSQSIASFFQPRKQLDKVTEAEARWTLFTAKHNLSFLASDHATRLFKAIYVPRL